MTPQPQTTKTSSYIGRFAPSPTGPLHQGSLLTAVASYLDARQAGGKWLVRMEDLDPPREQPGAADDILRSLEAHGLEWDGSVMWQSQRSEAYVAHLHQLDQQGLTFLCDCTRKHLANLNAGYDGNCRERQLQAAQTATRLKVPHGDVCFEDIFQGLQQQNLQRDTGDFVVHRKDGLFAYQLAVVVDDISQDITHIIRGCDLLDSTPKQLLLYDVFKQPRPQFGHLPVIVNSEGQKLSKQTFAPALDDQQAAQSLSEVIVTLGMKLPKPLVGDRCSTQLEWALTHWNRTNIPEGLRIEPQHIGIPPES